MSFSDTPFSQIRSLLKATALVQTNKNTSPIPQAFQGRDIRTPATELSNLLTGSIPAGYN